MLQVGVLFGSAQARALGGVVFLFFATLFVFELLAEIRFSPLFYPLGFGLFVGGCFSVGFGFCLGSFLGLFGFDFGIVCFIPGFGGLK